MRYVFYQFYNLKKMTFGKLSQMKTSHLEMKNKITHENKTKSQIALC